MTSDILQSNPLGIAPPTDGEELMGAFDRLLTSGALYPARHIHFTAASAEFRTVLTAHGGSLVIVASGENLRIAKETLTAEIRGVERVSGLMDKLGIHRIRITTGAPEADLHSLATTLLGHRREADTRGHLAEVDFGDLPDTIQVVPKVFARQWAEAGAASVGEAVDAIISELSVRGKSEDLLSSCRETLQDLFEVLLARSQSALSSEKSDAEDEDTQEKLAAGARDLGEALNSLIDRDGDLSRLREAIAEAMEDTNADIDHTAARILLQALGGRGAPASEDMPTGVEARSLADDTEYKVPLVELRKELADIANAGRNDEILGRPDLREEISIYLNVLSEGAGSGGGARALAEVTRCLDHLTDPHRDVFLQDAVRSLLEDSDPRGIDPVVERIAAVIRREGIEAVSWFWNTVCKDADDRVAIAAWPHLVAEFMDTDVEGLEQLRGVKHLVCRAGDREADNCRERLERLHVFNDRKSGQALILAGDRPFFHLFAVLLATMRGRTLGTWLQERLSQTAPDKNTLVMAQALGPYSTDQLSVYREWLPTVAEPGSPPSQAALDAVRRRIDTLPKSERSAGWLPDALTMLSVHCPASSQRLLERIIYERYFWPFRVWPSETRLAARRALETAERQREQRREGP